MKLGALLRITGAVMRTNRLIVIDDVPGQWWIKEPIDRAMNRYREAHTRTAIRAGAIDPHAQQEFVPPWWWRYRQGLECGWCVSVHVSVWMLTVENLLPNRGTARAVWNTVTAALALSEVTANAGQILGDYEVPDEDD